MVKTTLDLRAGDWVQVRSRDEILATLDGHGRLENLPFMPEMFQYCGRRLRVYKRADKTCEYTQEWSIRRMKDAVHLENTRCDGSGHSGCEAACLIFWKEAWLKRAENDVVSAESLRPGRSRASKYSGTLHRGKYSGRQAGRQTLRATQSTSLSEATTVPSFTSYMNFWDPRQYIRDLRSGNLDSGLARNSRGQRALDMILAALRLLQASIIGLYNEIQEKRHGSRYPFIEGTAEKPPMMLLNLQPGELVQVRSRDEIMSTLDKSQKNRGLWFDSEMLPYCDGIYRVLRQVHTIIDEKTGKLITMKNPCIVLDGVICKSDYHRLCPRAIYPYWREAWLKRAAEVREPISPKQASVTCERS